MIISIVNICTSFPFSSLNIGFVQVGYPEVRFGRKIDFQILFSICRKVNPSTFRSLL